VKLDLKRQEDFFRPLKEHPSHVLVTDIGSGPVNGGKEKVLKPFWNREASKEISRPLRRVVAHRDRLCRFAFDLLEHIFSINGVKLLVLNEKNGESTSKDLADDIMSIVHIYSCREMGRRRYKSKENKTVSDCRTEENTKKLDGCESLKASL